MKLKVLLLAVAMCLGGVVSAAAPASPTIWASGYINGAMNIAVPYDANVTYYAVEYREVGQEEWQTAEGGNKETFDKNNIKLTCWYLKTSYTGEREWRIRALNNDGANEWVSAGTHKATVNVTGRLIGNTGGNAGVQAPSNAVDGRLATWIDATTNNGDDAWVGYEFSRPTKIVGIRFIPRLDNQKLANRYQNSHFQIASDASFSDAQDIYVVPSNYALSPQITEVYFEEPITANVIRHWKQSGGFESSAEVEFIPAEAPFVPQLTVEMDDITTFNAKVTGNFGGEIAGQEYVLERALHANGPWVEVARGTKPDGEELSVEYVDEDLYVGVQYYYRARVITGHPYFVGDEVIGEPVSYKRFRRLERSWDDETTMLPGVTVLTKGSDGTVYEGTKLAFNGIKTDRPDTSASTIQNGPLGCDFGENVWVGAIAYICRNDNVCYSRVKNAKMFADSADDTTYENRIEVHGKFTQASQDTTLYYEPMEKVLDEGAQLYYMMAESDFHCNVAELMFFGWTQADLDAAPVVQAPENMSIVRGATGAAVIRWDSANHAQDYRIERRVRGEETWNTLASGVTALTYTDETSYIHGTTYEYRVIANGGELGEATSTTITFMYYTLGNGTGLACSIITPYTWASHALTDQTTCTSLGPRGVNLAAEAMTSCESGMRVMWSGKLIVPVDGTYTFSYDGVNAAGGVNIDGANLFSLNHFRPDEYNGSYSSARTLTAGEHTIEVEVGTGIGERALTLMWEGPIAREAIPVSQLIPSEVAPSNKLGDWAVYHFGTQHAGWAWEVSEGVYRIYDTANLGTVDNNWSVHMMYCAKPITTSDFEISCDILVPQIYAAPQLIARNDTGDFIAIEFALESYGYHVRQRLYNAATQTSTLLINQRLSDSSANNTVSHLRLEKRGNIFRLWYVNPKAASDGEQLLNEWVDGSDGVTIGRATSCGFASGTTGVSDLYTTEFSNIRLRLLNAPSVIHIR